MAIHTTYYFRFVHNNVGINLFIIVLILGQNNEGINNDIKAIADGDVRSRTTSKRPEQRTRSKKTSSKGKHRPYRDASTPTAHSIATDAIKHELELERRSASCRRAKDRRHLSGSHTNTDNSRQESSNLIMSTSVGNTLQRNYGGCSGGGYADGADITRRTYYRGGITGRKAKSNDFLDRMDTSMTNPSFAALGMNAFGISGSVTGGLSCISKSSSAAAKMSRIGIVH